MRGCLALALAGCSFSANVGGQPGDGGTDVPGDRPDAVVPLRVTDGLIGFWTFDETSGAASVADTAGTAAPVALEVVTSTSIPPPTFSMGYASATGAGGARIISEPGTSARLSTDPATAGGVTLEAWVRPATSSQGTTSPRFIAGLARSVTERNIVLLQLGDKYVARVRTTAALDGSPDLVSTTAASSALLTHLVVVADATQRKLYVDGVEQATSVAGGPLLWDTTAPMAIFDEPQHTRQWLGTIGLVALYARALTAAEVQHNYDVGPDAP